MNELEEILELVENLIKTNNNKSLSYIQKTILRESLANPKKTYDQIAEEYGYSDNYIKQRVAPELWKMLSESLAEKVNKKNCYSLLEKALKVNPKKAFSQPILTRLESPEGQVPLDSAFYIERQPEEGRCYEEMLKNGALLRIKAPKKMGKSSLMVRLLNYAKKQNYHTVRLSLNCADKAVFTSTEKFLRWLCANATRHLQLESKLNDFWDKDIGILLSCSLYFQGYLLQEINNPILLAIDEVNQIFDYPDLTRDFLCLLRSWHEETKDIYVWQKLRLLLVNSTDVYIPLNINKSPFNVGLSIELLPFTQAQVQDLALRHGLNLTYLELNLLIDLLGGFPYLVRLALYESVRRKISLENLLVSAATDTGIFSSHLHSQLWYLQKNTELATAYQQVVKADEPISLEQVKGFKLQSLGLVNLQGDLATVSCDLYRKYFRVKFAE